MGSQRKNGSCFCNLQSFNETIQEGRSKKQNIVLMRKIIVLLFLILIGCSSVQNVISYDFKEVFSLDAKNNMLFIEITLNGKPGILLIDTGSSKSLLDINKAEEYGYQYLLLATDQYIGLGGLQDIYVVFAANIEEFFTPFLGTDLSEITGYFNKDGIEIVGILGADFLNMHQMVIDFKKNLMYKRL
jgi:hypothetical protein